MESQDSFWFSDNASDHRATFSPCRTYRYSLWRHFANARVDRYAMFIGLNPSTADEVNNDPTVRRCMRYAQAWGYNALCMTNIFAFRATDPRVMKAVDDPIGPDNDQALQTIAHGAGIVIAAWGTHGAHNDRAAQVLKLVPKLHCLRVTKDGHPAHPLYLPAALEPIHYEGLP